MSSLFYSPDFVFLHAFVHAVTSRILFSIPTGAPSAPVKIILIVLLLILSGGFLWSPQSKSVLYSGLGVAL